MGMLEDDGKLKADLSSSLSVLRGLVGLQVSASLFRGFLATLAGRYAILPPPGHMRSALEPLLHGAFHGFYIRFQFLVVGNIWPLLEALRTRFVVLSGLRTLPLPVWKDRP